MSVSPVYTLVFTQLEKPVEDLNELIISKKELSSPIDIPPSILANIETLCRWCVFNMENQTIGEVKASVCLSQKGGFQLETTDIKMKELLKNFPSMGFPISQEDAKNYPDLKQKEASEGLSQAMGLENSEDIVFVDYFSWLLLESNRESLDLNLHLLGNTITSKSGFTTGFLRFPPMLKHISESFSKNLESDQPKIGIVGPPECYFLKNRFPSFPNLLNYFPYFPRPNLSFLTRKHA